MFTQDAAPGRQELFTPTLNITTAAAMPLLRDLCVMLVEDDARLAMHLSAMLGEQGCRIIGPFGTVTPAHAALEVARPDAAVLDIDLHGVMSFPVADALGRANVPFLWLSGSSSGILTQHLRVQPFLPKPFEQTILLSAMARLLKTT
jgi:DNA-binding response OmpR family regulator